MNNGANSKGFHILRIRLKYLLKDFGELMRDLRGPLRIKIKLTQEKSLIHHVHLPTLAEILKG